MPWPITVGKIKIKKKPPCTNHIYYNYKDVTYDSDGWADCRFYLPEEFDLCDLKTKQGKFLRGWHTGQTWDGLHLKRTDRIEYWKRYEEKELAL
jgi:hypothetical protein